ncbi:MAG: cupin-like domain-containing protein [Burkholderiales bacterium]|nr:cupin-like domain-containing protein [Burkholderiales bacterium]
MKNQVMENRIDDSWRAWIAENLMLGGLPIHLAQILQSKGFSLGNASEEIEKASRSPYLQGARRLRNRVAKRDWVLDIYRKLSHLQNHEIPRRHQLSREEFLQDYYSQNKPVIITGMMHDWPALAKWNLDYFRQTCGDAEVEVQYGRSQDQNYELNSLAHKKLMPFAQYIDQVEQAGQTNDFYMTANNDGRNRQALDVLWQDIVQLPEYLRADPNQRGFFWFGPKGTITPFHHDLTNNFMAQVMGRKRIHMIPAYQVAQVYNMRHCFTEVDGLQIDYARFPNMRDVRIQQCEIGPGEILFLPVGCWHLVEGLETSVTIAFTNFLWDNDYFSNYPPDHDF